MRLSVYLYRGVDKAIAYSEVMWIVVSRDLLCVTR